MTHGTTEAGNSFEDPTAAETEVAGALDPQALLADWANGSDEWVRLLVSEVVATGRPVGAPTIEKAYQLFRQEKALDTRDLPAVAKLGVDARQDESAPPLSVTRISEVHGVNALVAGAVIEPDVGLTILYGENGTGKTGYSRIFKALANSRTADTILGNIDGDVVEAQSASIEYKLGDAAHAFAWTGERGVPPFTRMSIFDSPAVTTHVDEDLDYVYTPASLALFNHVTAAIQAVTGKIDAAIATLGTGGSGLLSRFQRGSSIYPLIETLGASTDMFELRAKADTGEDGGKRVDVLTETVAALRANTLGTQIAAAKSQQRVVAQAAGAAGALLEWDPAAYNEALARRAQLNADNETFRRELFAAADLPADPDDTWSAFIEAGEAYRQHLIQLRAHDAERCLYCRQPLMNPARDLIARYSTYLEDKIAAEIRSTDAELADLRRQVAGIQAGELDSFVEEYKDQNEKPIYFSHVSAIAEAVREVATAVAADAPVGVRIAEVVATPKDAVDSSLTAIGETIESLEAQQKNRTKVLDEKQAELLELKDAVELGKSWPLIETQVNSAKEADRLKTLKRLLPSLGRAVTELAKTASDQMINQSFDALFIEECEALRTPVLKLLFVGREGKAQRRKVMSGRYKPSKVLSEGEQKVLALADFLAEARLGGITAPVIFDDPVSSLDHRRIKEVAQRIARLSGDHQVIVFTHDILFTTMLLDLVEKSKRYAYFQVTDEHGKGQVARATGPRTDTLSAIRKRIEEAIRSAKIQDGETRDALVRVGYSHIRAWCEVFTEEELLRGVTKRYRANVQMTTLVRIDGKKLDAISPKVTEIFEIACRHTEAHSQPLITLGISPTLAGLEEHWAELQALKQLNDA